MTNIANPPIRFTAAVVDWCLGILLLFLAPSLYLSSANSPADIFNNLGLFIVISIFGGFAYALLQTYLTSSFGGSIGKLICGLQVVGPTSQHISFTRSLFRQYVGSIVSSSLLWLGYVWILVDKKTRRGWHDLVSDTYVTISNPAGTATGLIAAVLLTAASLWTISQTISQFSTNQSLYQSLFSEFNAE